MAVASIFRRSMKIQVVVAISALLVMGGTLGTSGNANAQQTSSGSPAAAPAKPAVGSMVDPAPALEAMLSGYEADMMRLAKLMPAEKYDFTPDSLKIPGSRFTGVRTFAEQIKHITQDNLYASGDTTGTAPTAAQLEAVTDLKTKDEIVAGLVASFKTFHKAVSTLSPDNALEVVAGDTLITRATGAATGVAHGYNHYGQIVEYARMCGISPSGK